jgi:hypothetical protein
MLEEEDGTFWDTLGHLRTQPATNPSPKSRKQTKTSLLKNFAPSLLLLLHTFQKIKLKSTSILPNALAISLFVNILFYGKYATKIPIGHI